MTEAQIVVEVCPGPLDPQQLLAKLDLDGCGSVVSFLGLTRGMEGGREISALEFDGWELRLKDELATICSEAISNFHVRCIALSHRVGIVGVSAPIVSIHVGSAHRQEGFEACSWLISSLKKHASLWKLQHFTDGASEWKEGLG